MKKCPVCQQTYTDDSLNFCLNDGGVLEKSLDDAPPTVFMNQARVTSPTKPTDWSGVQPPPSSWQNFPVAQNQASMTPPAMIVQNQALPLVSLALGILSLLLFCCYGGFLLGIPAVITGFIGMNNAKNDPASYGGHGLAIAGMVIGAISFLGAIAMLLFGILANLK